MARLMSGRVLSVVTVLAMLVAVLSVVAVAGVVTAPGAAAATGGSPSAEAVALTQAAKTGKRVEIPEEDTETDTVFANPDGTITAEIASAPIRVRDDSGKLVRIDNSLESDSGRLAPAASPTDVSMSKTGSGVLVDLATGSDDSLGLGAPVGLDAPSVDGDTATYAVSGSDPASVQVSANSSGFAANVILPAAPSVAPTYTFPLHLDGGLKVALEHGQLVFRNTDDEVVAVSNLLQMWDSHTDAAGDADHLNPVDAELVDTAGGGTALQLRPSMDFLTDPGTQYPVTVDPTISPVKRSSDWLVSSATPDTSNGSTYSARVGLNGSVKYRTFEKFVIDPYLGRTVTSANLRMYQYYSVSCASKTTSLYPVESPSPNAITWNNQQSVNTDARWSSTYTGNTGLTGGTCGAGGFVNMDVTKMMSGYTTRDLNSAYNGNDTDTATHIATIRLSGSESDTSFEKRFCAINTDQAPSTSDCAQGAGGTLTDRGPVLSLTYAPQLGDKSSYSMTTHELNDRTTLKVNTQNGNAVIKADDIKINGLGGGINISRYYNSRAETTGTAATVSSLGPKWKLSVGPDVLLRKRDTYRYDYQLASGELDGPFVRGTQTASTTTSDDYNQLKRSLGGIGADLVDNTNDTNVDDRGFKLTMHQSQTVYLFKDIDTTAGDDNLYMVRSTDRSGNKTDYNYVAGTHRLSSITDASGQSLSFTYDSAGTRLTQISDSNNADDSTPRTWKYHYNSAGELDSYTNPDPDPTKNTTNYHWATAPDGTDYIDTITDPATNPTTNPANSRPTTTLTTTDGEVTAVRFKSSTSNDTDVVGYDYTYSSTATARCDNTKDDYSTDVVSTATTGGTDKKTTYCFRDRKATIARTASVRDGEDNKVSQEFSVDDQPTIGTGGGTNAGEGKTGSTTNTYGGTNLEDRLQQTTDPTDANATRGTSTNYTYNTPSSKKGDKWLPSSKVDGNLSCTRYQYDDKGRLSDSWLVTPTNCVDTGAPSGLHYQQHFNDNGTVDWSSDPNGDATSKRTDYTYWDTDTDGYVAGTKGLVKSVSKPGGSCDTDTSYRKLCTSYTYDGLGRIKTMTDGRGKVTSYTYDRLDRTLQARVDGASSCVPTAGTCVSNTYDAEGNLTSRLDTRGSSTFSYDRMNRQTQVSTPDGNTVGYAYNADGKLTTLETTVSGEPKQTTTYGYDHAEQVSSVTNTNLSGDGTITLTHDHDSKLKTTVFPTTNTGDKAKIARDYTNAGRPNTITVTSGADPSGTQLPDWNYDYKISTVAGLVDTNQVQKITVNGSTTAINQVLNYTYDNDKGGRLKNAAIDGSSSNYYEYTYDDAANLRSEKIGTNTTYWGYDRAGQQCWQGPTDDDSSHPSTTDRKLDDSCAGTINGTGNVKVSNDKAGNSLGTTATPLTYNPYNQVASINGLTQGYHDLGNDLRVVTSPTTSLVNSSLGITARRTTDTGGTTTGVTYYVRDPDGKILAEYGTGTTAGTYYYVTNAQDSVTTLLTTAGNRAAYYRYTPYGDPTIVEDNTTTNAATANPIRYISGYYDIEGDNYTKLGARYYDNHGHFTQTDPKPGSLSDPLSQLGYGYAQTDPLNNEDASGLSVDLPSVFGAVKDLESLSGKVGPAVGVLNAGYQFYANGWKAGVSATVGFGVGTAVGAACGTIALPTVVGEPVCAAASIASGTLAENGTKSLLN